MSQQVDSHALEQGNKQNIIVTQNMDSNTSVYSSLTSDSESQYLTPSGQK